MQVCHPDMPDGDAGRFRKIAWAAEDLEGKVLLVAIGCLPNEWFQTWAMYSVVAQSHAGTG